VIGAGTVAALRFVEARSERKQDARGSFQDVPTRQLPPWMAIAVVVVALLTSATAGYQIFQVGDSGSAAAWSEFSTR
jgi:hypothetical protein